MKNRPSIGEQLLELTIQKELLKLGAPRRMIKRRTIQDLKQSCLREDNIKILKANGERHVILRITPD